MIMVIRVSVLELIDIWEMWQFLLCFTIWRPLGKHAHNNLIGNQISIKLAAFSSRHVWAVKTTACFSLPKIYKSLKYNTAKS